MLVAQYGVDVSSSHLYFHTLLASENAYTCSWIYISPYCMLTRMQYVLFKVTSDSSPALFFLNYQYSIA